MLLSLINNFPIKYLTHMKRMNILTINYPMFQKRFSFYIFAIKIKYKNAPVIFFFSENIKI